MKSIFCLSFSANQGTSLSFRKSGTIVKPCENMEKATRLKATATIASRWGTSDDRLRAKANANAPRKPPQNRIC
jgi:hypothetical protein